MLTTIQDMRISYELRMVTQNGAQTALLKLSTKVFVRETVRHLQGGQQLVLQS